MPAHPYSCSTALLTHILVDILVVQVLFSHCLRHYNRALLYMRRSEYLLRITSGANHPNLAGERCSLALLCMNVCVYMRLSIYACMCVQVSLHVCMHVCTCVSLSMHACVYRCRSMYACMCVHASTHMPPCQAALYINTAMIYHVSYHDIQESCLLS